MGGSSFVGKNFVSYAAEQGERLCATYHRNHTFLDAMSRYHNVEPLNLDLLIDSPPESYETCLYLAGNSNHGLASENPVADLTLNAVGLVNFLRHAHHFKSFILLSSAAVYHGHRGFVSPRTALAPEHPYAISKTAAECYVRFFTRTGKIDNHLILRLYHVFGPHEPSRRIMARLLEAFLTKGEKQFTVNGDGKTLMDVIYIDELVKLLFNALVTQKFENETLDVCSGNPMTLIELATKTAQALGVSARVDTNSVSIDPILFWSAPEANMRFLYPRERVSLDDGIRLYGASLRENLMKARADTT